MTSKTIHALNITVPLKVSKTAARGSGYLKIVME